VLTTDQKGAVAEAAVTLTAVKSGFGVYRPVVEGGRCDLVLEVRNHFLRVQCKSVRRCGDVIGIRCYSSRRSRAGLVKRGYTLDEVDLIIAFCPETDRCYVVPPRMFHGRSHVQLRLAATRNSQAVGIHWARDHEFERLDWARPGAIAQLGERLPGRQEVAGSSPAGSTTCF
jgi:hypothetical protein